MQKGKFSNRVSAVVVLVILTAMAVMVGRQWSRNALITRCAGNQSELNEAMYSFVVESNDSPPPFPLHPDETGGSYWLLLWSTLITADVLCARTGENGKPTDPPLSRGSRCLSGTVNLLPVRNRSKPTEVRS